MPRTLQDGGIAWGGIVARVLGALALVFATWNPDGFSYWHWALLPARTGGLATFGAAKALVGVLLLAAWVVLLQATRRALGVLGVVLAAAATSAVVWLLIEQHLASARTTTGLARTALIVLGVVLGIGLSWSSVRSRVTGQVVTDEV